MMCLVILRGVRGLTISKCVTLCIFRYENKDRGKIGKNLRFGG